MDVDAVIAAAREQTGLTDFGDPAILEGLEVLLKAYETEAKLTERGRASCEGNLVAALANRMRVEDWLTRHPEILEKPIDRPMFVFGLPRTGTTHLINLLSVDPARRCFLRWEAFDSVPPPKTAELHAGPRYEKAQAFIDMSVKHAPQISAIHHENGDSPTECQFAMAPSFCAQVYESMSDIPSYRTWFLETSYLPAFRYEKRLLQFLQSEAPGRWTLKNPWHPLFLNDLTTVFPDAQLVMTHRDPVEVVGSACSLIKHVRRMLSDTVDLEGIGASMVDMFTIMIERQDAYRARHGQDSIVDVQYAGIVRDPIGEIRKIYARYDEPLTAQAEAAMHKYLADNPQGKHGKHEYTLEEFGLTRAGVRERFAGYVERYGVVVRD